MPEPGGSEVERRLPIWECAHHPRTPSDLAQDALERIVGADTPPMLLRDAARVMWGELLKNREDPITHSFEICDADGTILLTLPFMEVLEVARGATRSRIIKRTANLLRVIAILPVSGGSEPYQRLDDPILVYTPIALR